MLTTIIIAIACTSGGYLFGAVWASGNLVRRVASLKADLENAQAHLEAQKVELADANESISEKNELIRTLDGEADQYADIIMKWVPARNAKGMFVSKKVG